MPRPSKGARLYRRKDGSWSILDGRIERRTGATSREEAEAALAEYIRQRGRPSGPSEPDRLQIGEVLIAYLEEHAPHTADPARISYAVEALAKFWGDLPVSAITKNTCRRYAATRVRHDRDGVEHPIGAGTIRRELGTLRAALKYCEEEGRLTRAPTVHMPDKPEPKDRWLTREEAAKLLMAARRNKHLAYFILIGLYTGTRKEAIMSLAFTPHTVGGWIDCDSGVIYRRAQDMRQTSKRKPPARMPRKLLGHMRRLKAKGQRWAVQFKGGRVQSVRTAWAAACTDSGITGISPHTLRHTAITWAMHAGVPLADASGYFGVSIEMLERVYLHHHPAFQERTANAMNRV